jgi:hypothetical protein
MAHSQKGADARHNSRYAAVETARVSVPSR